MRSIRLFAAGITILAITACTTSTLVRTDATAPSLTPLPSVEAGASAVRAPSASSAASRASAQSATPSESAATLLVEVSAQNIAFDPTELSVAADQAFQIVFANNDTGVPHWIVIKDAAGTSVFEGEFFVGVASRNYDVQALPAGRYAFVCRVHPNMVGTLTAE